MNKFFTAAGTAVLGLITSALNSSTSTGEVKGPLLQRGLKNPRLPAASADSQVIDEKDWSPDKHDSSLYELAASNPHVIAASLFSTKNR